MKVSRNTEAIDTVDQRCCSHRSRQTEKQKQRMIDNGRYAKCKYTEVVSDQRNLMGDGCVNERRTEGGEGDGSGWRKESECVMHARIGAFKTCQRPVQIEIYFRGFLGCFRNSKSVDLLSPDKQ